ncbi:phosphatidylinositol-glycan biosynthesis class w protein [Anaeramoeba flamelloides]|uniref:Phosphatidylinositol-glycan biosynthesis class w protein n=1 Tax=Anaeramoeba flamelloides TaxID=1746091 RepID=A0AAV7ZLK0_9EUKA|nr:phosphatidylinositol-glycan biosynthesis class w protein [Anaeramoeba flamelloides]
MATFKGDDYKRVKEKFISGNIGTGPLEPTLVTLIPITGFLVTKAILNSLAVKGIKIKRQHIGIYEFILIIFPMVLGMSVPSLVWHIFGFNLLVCLLLHFTVAPFFQKFNLKSVNPLRPSIVRKSRVSLLFLTAIAIMAVNFKCFPRKFSKTEYYGFALMDFGVGEFIIVNGLVCGPVRIFAQWTRERELEKNKKQPKDEEKSTNNLLLAPKSDFNILHHFFRFFVDPLQDFKNNFVKVTQGVNPFDYLPKRNMRTNKNANQKNEPNETQFKLNDEDIERDSRLGKANSDKKGLVKEENKQNLAFKFAGKKKPKFYDKKLNDEIDNETQTEFETQITPIPKANKNDKKRNTQGHTENDIRDNGKDNDLGNEFGTEKTNDTLQKKSVSLKKQTKKKSIFSCVFPFVRIFIKGCLYSYPLVIVGLCRFLTLILTNYQRHFSEYGVHWNFFYTLASITFLSTILFNFIQPKYAAFYGVMIMLGHQFALKNGMRDFLQFAQRTNFFSKNKEGFASLPGFFALFLVACTIGYYIFKQGDSKKNWIKLYKSFIAIDIILWICYYFSNTFIEPVSRRSVNLSYGFCVFAHFILQLIGYITIDCFTVPYHEEIAPIYMKNLPLNERSTSITIGLNSNQLGLFIFANICVGITNCTFQTIYLSKISGFIYVLLYMASFSTFGIISHIKGLRFKFW